MDGEMSKAARLDEFLTREYGMHGTWVLSMESFDEDMNQGVIIDFQEGSSDWKAAGLSQTASDVLRDMVRSGWQE